ncbi:MAG TPA: DUF4136 domain-containing protein [Vicinamibacterales bacterium]|jgi:hypothetical protein|nr:DUF4136 domain-containing protein [Vicinamibacterales bacterium]
MRSFIVAAVATLLLPTAAAAQKTTYDYDKSATFDAYKTYTLKDGTKVGDPLIDNRIVNALEAELKKKGLTRSDTTPDLAIVYHVAFDKQQDITAWNTGGGPYRYGWGGGWGTTDIRVNEILVGTLVVDIADVKTNQVVWRGLGVKEVNTTAKPEQRDKSIQQAVQKILKEYPPKIKK